jgi:hypothetical protein
LLYAVFERRARSACEICGPGAKEADIARYEQSPENFSSHKNTFVIIYDIRWGI